MMEAKYGLRCTIEDCHAIQGSQIICYCLLETVKKRKRERSHGGVLGVNGKVRDVVNCFCNISVCSNTHSWGSLLAWIYSWLSLFIAREDGINEL